MHCCSSKGKSDPGLHLQGHCWKEQRLNRPTLLRTCQATPGMQSAAWCLQFEKDVDRLDRVQRRVSELVKRLKNMYCEERLKDLLCWEKKKLRGDFITVLW